MKPGHTEPMFFSTQGEWQAYLNLELKKNQRGTRITRSRHRGPLYVQKPFYPEGGDCAHIYLLHPPGGLVSGDSLTIDVELAEQAHGLFTTPGAARAYKAREQISTQKQINRFNLTEKSVLEWFPMETIIYPGADAEVTTTFSLQKSSALITWEITCFGLPARQEPFDSGCFQQSYRVERDGLPLFIDRLDFNARNHALFRSEAGFRSRTVSGFMLATLPKGLDAQGLGEQLREYLSSSKLDTVFSLSQLGELILVRYLGESAFQCRQVFTQLWALLRPALLQRKASKPRIWLT